MDKPLVKISYKLANGSQICVEVSTSVQELLEQSDRQIRSQRRQDRRHIDFVEYIDELTDPAMINPQSDPADLVIRMESYIQLYAAIDKLSEVQRRRLQGQYQTADNPIFEVFYLANAKAVISDFSGNPPKEYTL